MDIRKILGMSPGMDLQDLLDLGLFPREGRRCHLLRRCWGVDGMGWKDEGSGSVVVLKLTPLTWFFVGYSQEWPLWRFGEVFNLMFMICAPKTVKINGSRSL